MPATKAQRTLSIRLAGRVILITAHGKTDVYRVERLPDDGPAVLLRWTKRQNGTTASRYTVAVEGAEGYRGCQCKGFQFRGECRHTAASCVLLAKGYYQEID